MSLNRREFLSNSVAAGVASHLPAKPTAKRKRPNVLYVFDDQHRAVSLPGEPFAAVAAPNIDRFRRDNMSLDTCISNYPLCCPYRAVLASGKYSAVNGVMSNMIALKTDEYTIHKAFKHSGYRVGYVGKWHLNGDHDENFAWIPPGPKRFEIDDWHIWEATNEHYKCFTYDDQGNKIVTKNWAPVDMTDQAIGLLGDYKKLPADQPWFLTVSYNPPHPPFDPPQAERDQNPVSAQKYRPNVKIGPEGEAPWLKNVDGFHRAMQGYIGGITGIDEQFGRLMKALDDSGMAEDTIVIFTSDHGEMMGSQGKKGKVVPWDESNHVPFMVRYPGVTPKGGSTKQIFAAIDIYPSLCAFAGIAVPAHCQGHDLSGLWKGKTVPAAPEIVFIQNGGSSETPQHAAGGGPRQRRRQQQAAGNDGVPASGDASISEEDGGAHPYRGVRTQQWTYTVAPNGRWLLYDNHADPYQMQNLAHDPQHGPLMDGFDVQLKAWLARTGDPFAFPALS